MEIYRPGMGKFSSQTLKAGETSGSKNSRSNSPEVYSQETPESEVSGASKSEVSSKKDEKPKQRPGTISSSRGQQQQQVSKFFKIDYSSC